jgi:hypothetical protein
VQPAGSRAHQYLRKSPRHKGRFTTQASQAPAAAHLAARYGGKANLFTGLAARRAFGAAHDGAAHDDAAWGVPQPYLQMLPEPKTAIALGRHGLG